MFETLMSLQIQTVNGEMDEDKENKVSKWAIEFQAYISCLIWRRKVTRYESK